MYIIDLYCKNANCPEMSVRSSRKRPLSSRSSPLPQKKHQIQYQSSFSNTLTSANGNDEDHARKQATDTVRGQFGKGLSTKSITLTELIEATGIDESFIHCVISDDHILELACFVCDPWKLIAQYIGLKVHEITAIDEDYRTVDERRVAALQKWRERNSLRATYRCLIQTLLRYQRDDTARRVCEYLMTKSPAEIKISRNTCVQDARSVDMKVEVLKKEFGQVLRSFSQEMGMGVKDLQEYIATIHLFRSSNDVPSCLLQDVPSIYHLLLNLQQFFINPVIFEEILESCKAKAQQTCRLMKVYTNSLQQFEENTKLKDIAEMNYEFKTIHVLSCYSEVEVKLKDAWKDKTLAVLKQFLYRANCKLWFLERASIGSIVLVFLIPESEKRYLRQSCLVDKLGETRLLV